jgi:hypothetical protein
MLKITQTDYKTHQLYNNRIAQLLGLGHKVYVTAYMPLGSFDVKYKVHLSLIDVLVFRQAVYPLSTTKLTLGQKQPKSRWGSVELDTMRAIESDGFLQALKELFK